MEIKKNPSANIERLRLPILSTALLFTGGLVLASFSYTAELRDHQQKASNDSDLTIEFIEEFNEPEVTPPDIAPQQELILPPPSEDIIVDSNSTIIPTSVVNLDPPDIKIDKKDVIVIKEEIVEFPDVEAQFDGQLQSWIAENIQYPEIAIQNDDQGKVYLSFVVEKDGSISSVVIERGVTQEIDREAKRVLRKMPKWKPAEVKGKNVRTRCRVPINFTLE